MGSEVGKISKTELAHWGWLVLIGSFAVVLDVVAKEVIPYLQSTDGTFNAALVAGLTILLELARRFLTNTKTEPSKEDPTKMVPVGDSLLTVMLKKLGLKK